LNRGARDGLKPFWVLLVLSGYLFVRGFSGFPRIRDRRPDSFLSLRQWPSGSGSSSAGTGLPSAGKYLIIQARKSAGPNFGILVSKFLMAPQIAGN
jgi:hypothetical protein